MSGWSFSSHWDGNRPSRHQLECVFPLGASDYSANALGLSVAAAMETTGVDTTTVETSAVETPGEMDASTEAWSAVKGKGTGGTKMAEAVIDTVMHAELTLRPAIMKSVGVADHRRRAINVGAISRSKMMGEVSTLVVDNAVSVPIGSPVVPAPAKSRVGSDPNA